MMMVVRCSRQQYDIAKRTLDVVVSAAALTASLPLQTLTAIAVLAGHGRPILFRQTRPGRGGVPFEILKFRTMRHPDVSHTTDAERLTELGRFLRSTSLDELPELWNVLRGDMSVVGPRPLLMEYLPMYTPEQVRRHEVRPGITGLAQVSGRNNLPWNDRLALDVLYVDTRNLRLDLKILARTVLAVVRRKGISQEGHATMEPFRGSGVVADD